MPQNLIRCSYLNSKHQQREDDMKSTNSKKARNEIAKLMNSIAHGWIMYGEAQAKDNREGRLKWHDSVARATQELGDLYGIELLCYLPKV
jgi:hypothetical protein